MVYKSNFWLRHQPSPNNNTRKNNAIRKNMQPIVFESSNTSRSNNNNSKKIFQPMGPRPKKYRTRKYSRSNRR